MRAYPACLTLLLVLGACGSSDSTTVKVEIRPTMVTVATGGAASFASTVNIQRMTANSLDVIVDNNVSVLTWTVVEPGGGTIAAAPTNSISMTYTAPATAGTYHVRATSKEKSSAYAEATVVVTPK